MEALTEFDHLLGDIEALKLKIKNLIEEKKKGEDRERKGDVIANCTIAYIELENCGFRISNASLIETL